MGFSFGGIQVNSKKRTAADLKRSDKIVLADYSNAETNLDVDTIIIVAPRPYNDHELAVLHELFTSWRIDKYLMVCAINIDPKDPASAEKAAHYIHKDGVTKFYRVNKNPIEKYIKPGSTVVTIGPALYSLIMEDDIYPNHTQQRIFGKTNFIFSRTLEEGTYYRIFPVEDLDLIFPPRTTSMVKDLRTGRECRVVTDYWYTDRPVRCAAGHESDHFTDNKLGAPTDSFRTKLTKMQFKMAAKGSKNPIPKIPTLTKHFIYNKEDFITKFYEPNKDKHGYVAWDLETGGFDFFKDKIGCITLSFDGLTGYYIKWSCLDDEMKKMLGEILRNNKQIGANLKFDCKFLWKNGVPEAHIDEDVIILGHILDETRSNSLKSLAFWYSEFGGYERPLDEYKAKCKIESYLDIPDGILREYAVMDAIVTYRVWENILAHMKQLDEEYPNEFTDNGMIDYYYDRRIPAVNMYAKIEYRGLYINKEKLDALRKEMRAYISNLENELCDDLGIDRGFEFTSVQKLGKLLESLGWEDLGRNKSGLYQVADFQIERWMKTRPQAKKLQLLKSLYTLLNGFVGDDEGTTGWPQYMTYHPEDNSWRIHANYQAMFTDSGRTKCKNPNFQNIPTRGMFSQEIKGCICTPDDDDYLIATIDYSSLQLRIADLDCGDKNLTEAFYVPGADLHSKTAYLSFFADKEIDVEIVEVEQDGKTYKFLGGEQVMTQRGEVFARELLETDTIMED